MPTVTGTIRQPVSSELATGVVRLFLVGEAGRPLTTAFDTSTGQAIEGVSTATLTAGVYSIVLPSNDVLLPAGTRWVRASPKGLVYLHVETSPASQNEDDILADPPGTLASAALDSHEDDLDLHGAGRELAISQLTVDTSTTGTKVDIADGSITLTVPDEPWEVEAQIPVGISAIGAVATVRLEDTAAAAVLIDDQLRGAAAPDYRLCRLMVRIPSLVGASGYSPTPGSEVTLKLTLDRTGSAGSAATAATFAGIAVVRDAFIAARRR